MLTLSRKVDYALVAVAGLVQLGGSAEHPVSAARLCDRYRLPNAMAMNILKKLQHSGLIGSTRGASGGYYLAKSPAWVSLLDVIEAVEGPVRMATCCGDEDESPPTSALADHSPRIGAKSAHAEPCVLQNACPITHRIQAVNRRIHDILRQITVRDLLDEQSVPVAVTAATHRVENPGMPIGLSGPPADAQPVRPTYKSPAP